MACVDDHRGSATLMRLLLAFFTWEAVISIVWGRYMLCQQPAIRIGERAGANSGTRNAKDNEGKQPVAREDLAYGAH